MFTTAPTGTTKPAPEETVRLRPGDLPIKLLPQAPKLRKPRKPMSR